MSDANLTPPQPPPVSDANAPVMSTPETLANIYFEPGATFEALRSRPRFLAAGLIAILAFMAFYLAYIQRIGYDKIVESEVAVAMKKNPDATEQQREQGLRVQKMPAVKQIRLWSPMLVLVIIFAAGAALYMLGANVMGGRMSYKQALSVWVYSTMPPLVLVTVLNFLLLFLNPPDDEAAIAQGVGRGLVRANPGVFVDSTANPVLSTALGALDVFAFFGLFLAALGLRKVGRLKSGSAWTVALTLWGVGVLLRLIAAYAFGSAS
jgi:Yip1 domain